MTIYPDELWESLADLSEESLETTLKRVADLAVRSIAGCDAVGVTLMTDDVPTTRAATGGRVYEVDHYQYDIGEGPCLQSVCDREVFEIEDMGTSERWVRFSRHAAERGIQASMSLPLIVRGSPMGALNLYSHSPRSFGDVDRERALMFGALAAVALANSQTYAASVRLGEQMREALSSRAVIDQAKGILMAREGCTADDAFEVLRTASQRANIKLRLMAEDIVTRTSTARAPRPRQPPPTDGAALGTG